MIDAVHRSGCDPVAMEFYGADTRPPLERSLHDVRSCDVYIGIVAWRYGSCPPGAIKSFPHLEYEEAARHHKHILLFHLDENAPWPVHHVDNSQREVKDLRSAHLRDRIVDRFSNFQQLVTKVQRALYRLYGATGPSVPELLPYTVDRNAQKEILAAAISCGRLERSPSVIVMYGTRNQAQGKFVEYIREQLLTQYLGVKNINNFAVGIRASEFDHSDVITRRIASCCHLAPTTDVATLSHQLHYSDSITTLWFPVEVDARWGRPQVRQITRLIDYFAQWPQHRPLRVLPIISAQYHEVTGWRSRLPWKLTASRGRFDRTIDQTVANCAGNCATVVLPELTNIEQMEVTAWADQPDVRRRLGHDPVPSIRVLFQNHEQSAKKNGIPMEDLATELTYLMGHSQEQERV